MTDHAVLEKGATFNGDVEMTGNKLNVHSHSDFRG